MPVAELSEFRVQRLAHERPSVLFTLLRGLAYFFHRDRPDDLEVNSRTASATIRGTDFVVEVDARERMTVTLLDGDMELRNDQGTLRLTRGQAGTARAWPGTVLNGRHQCHERGAMVLLLSRRPGPGRTRVARRGRARAA